MNAVSRHADLTTIDCLNPIPVLLPSREHSDGAGDVAPSPASPAPSLFTVSPQDGVPCPDMYEMPSVVTPHELYKLFERGECEHVAAVGQIVVSGRCTSIVDVSQQFAHELSIRDGIHHEQDPDYVTSSSVIRFCRMHGDRSGSAPVLVLEAAE